MRDGRRRRSRSRDRRGPVEAVDLDRLEVAPDIQSLFKQAVLLLVERRRLPCNISCINDTLRTLDRSWHFRKAGVFAFRQLAEWFAKQGVISLDLRYDTVLLKSTTLSNGRRAREGGADDRGSSRPPSPSSSPPHRMSPPPAHTSPGLPRRLSPAPRRYSPVARRYSPGRYIPVQRHYSVRQRSRSPGRGGRPPLVSSDPVRPEERWAMGDNDRLNDEDRDRWPMS
ncbi:hypothetical protein V8C86DRAFT_2878067 [Haematococcus lacustris]